MVALGYSQIPGVDFTENYSPVISDVAVRILLIIQMVKGYSGIQFDVETAFLEGRLEPSEYMYMKCPEGMVMESDECLKFAYSLCSCAQSMHSRDKLDVS